MEPPIVQIKIKLVGTGYDGVSLVSGVGVQIKLGSTGKAKA